MDPREGGTHEARVPVRGGLRALDALLQRLVLHATARARGWLGPGACGHLGALREPVGAHRCGGGYRVAVPAEVAAVWEVGGRVPGIEAAEAEIVPPLAKKALELQHAGADVVPVVSAERFLSDCPPCVIMENPVVVEGRYEVIPLRAGVSLGCCHIGVRSGELEHKSVPPASICGAVWCDASGHVPRSHKFLSPPHAIAVIFLSLFFHSIAIFLQATGRLALPWPEHPHVNTMRVECLLPLPPLFTPCQYVFA